MKRALPQLCLLGAVLIPASALALPVGPQLMHGAATVNTVDKTMTIQNTPNTILHWQQFNIAAGESVRFNQASALSAVLNRVTGGDPSKILGALSSNGKVFLINPAGVLIGAGARIDTAGFIASSLNLATEDFLAGRMIFRGDPNAGKVENQGTITASHGGQVYLIAPDVDNSGVITAPGGEVLLAAGHEALLLDSAHPDIAMTVSAPENRALNLGEIHAAAGRIGIFGGLVAQKGIVRADSVSKDAEGRIVLKATKQMQIDAGSTTTANAGEAGKGGNILVWSDETTEVHGLIAAEGGRTSGDGGFIETSGAKLRIGDSARVSTKAANGKTGTWLLDPTDITIAASGGNMTGADVGTALASNNFTIQTSAGGTGNGDIFVNDEITWSTGNMLTLNAHRNIAINQQISGNGKLFLQYAQGGGGDYIVKAPVNLRDGQNFSTQQGTTGAVIDYTVITALGSAGDESNSGATNSLQGLAYSTRLDGNFALGASIDASATSGWNGGLGFVPIGRYISGGDTGNFKGRFDGLGHTISNLTINRGNNISDPYSHSVGLFGTVGYEDIHATPKPEIRNVGLVGGSVTGRERVGALIGWKFNNGLVTNTYAQGTSVVGTGIASVGVYNMAAGGLVGVFDADTLANSWSSSNVRGTQRAGGLVGILYISAIISSAYATGNVTASINDISRDYGAGGLVGTTNGATITNAYATGRATATASNAGGLVGASSGASSIQNSYATGQVTGTANREGGLIGGLYGTVSLSNSFWDTTTTGQTAACGFGTCTGATGKTTAEMKDPATFTAWSSSIWQINAGSYPGLSGPTIFPPSPPSPPASVDTAETLSMVTEDLSQEVVTNLTTATDTADVPLSLALGPRQDAEVQPSESDDERENASPAQAAESAKDNKDGNSLPYCN